MKNLPLILALFIGYSFAEEEFPIELTCEMGPAIFYVKVEEVPEKTWIQLISNYEEPSMWSDLYNSLKNKKQFASKRKNKFFINSEKIFFTIPVGIAGLYFFEINRLTGKISNFVLGNGKCIKGFKEYGERKF